MATAKQLAARAKFSAMAKSGALAKARRKSPTKKPTKSPLRVYRNFSKSIGGTEIYILETSKDAKKWTFVDAYQDKKMPVEKAKILAAEYPSLFVRVRSEKLK